MMEDVVPYPGLPSCATHCFCRARYLLLIHSENKKSAGKAVVQTLPRLRDPRFIVGGLLYLSGFASLIYHDYLSHRLKVHPRNVEQSMFYEYLLESFSGLGNRVFWHRWKASSKEIAVMKNDHACNCAGDMCGYRNKGIDQHQSMTVDRSRSFASALTVSSFRGEQAYKTARATTRNTHKL